MTSILKRYSGSILLLILAFAYLTRMFQLNHPEIYMFDEVYHAVTAKLIARNDPAAFEWWNPPPEPNTAVDWLHPPLAKYTQALSMLAFGENSFGWRFSSVVFGTLVILMTYHLALVLTRDHKVGLVAAALASLDGLLLVQSRIAMNDIHVTFFILLTFYYYIRYLKHSSLKLLLFTGIAAGLAIGTKWSGLFALITVWLFEGLRLLATLLLKWKSLFKEYSLRQVFVVVGNHLGFLVLLPIGLYFAAYSLMFIQGKGWDHFKELHHQIWYYQTHLKETHPYQSRPWQWALDLRPVWYWVEYGENQRADVYAFGNPVLYWLGLGAVIISMGALLRQVVGNQGKKKLRSILTVFGSKLSNILQSPLLFLTTAYFLLWLPWELSPRIMFFYHYTPAVPLLCILLAYWLVTLWKKGGNDRFLAWVSFVLVFVTFCTWYPHWTGIPLSNQLKDSLYFSVTSWK